MRIVVQRITISVLAIGGPIGLCGCGVIGSPCGAAITTPCASGSYCKVAEGNCGDATAIGVCSALPEICTEIFAPVCGCDGVTYGNECQAAAAGVNVDHLGACQAEGQICGGIAALQCANGEYCRFDGGTCGATDQSGTCQPVPDVCTQEISPVCGCDDQTYNNACMAAQAGQSVKSEGACPVGGLNTRCGGLDNATCADGLFCKYEDGNCGSGDQSGQCLPIPDACIGVVDPVCGCDNVTYDNECLAEKAGKSVLSTGACPAGPQ